MMNYKNLIEKIEIMLPTSWIKDTIEEKFHITNGSLEINHIDKTSDPHIIKICWKLGNDSSRSYKRSKIIEIQLSRETLDDYSKQRGEIYCKSKFISFINNFNPNHQEAKGNPSPIEYCYI